MAGRSKLHSRSRVATSARLIGFAACLSMPRLIPPYLLAAPALPSATLVRVPERGADVCNAGCFGYSPAEGTWLCGTGIRNSDGGAVYANGTRCILEVLRSRVYQADDHLAAVIVHSAKLDGTERLRMSLPLDRALKLAPANMASVEEQELPAGEVISVPRTRHGLRLDLAPLCPGERHPLKTGWVATRIVVLCNHWPALTAASTKERLTKPNLGSSAKGAAAGRGKRTEPREVFRSAVDQCAESERFRVQYGPNPLHIAVVQQVTWRGMDYRFSDSRVRPIDLAYTCEDQ